MYAQFEEAIGNAQSTVRCLLQNMKAVRTEISVSWQALDKHIPKFEELQLRIHVKHKNGNCTPSALVFSMSSSSTTKLVYHLTLGNYEDRRDYEDISGTRTST